MTKFIQSFFFLSIPITLSTQDTDDEYVGTQPWNAMEVVMGGKISDKTDMYSYGCVIWEMIALSVPHVHLLGGGNYLFSTSSNL